MHLRGPFLILLLRDNAAAGIVLIVGDNHGIDARIGGALVQCGSTNRDNVAQIGVADGPRISVAIATAGGQGDDVDLARCQKY